MRTVAVAVVLTGWLIITSSARADFTDYYAFADNLPGGGYLYQAPGYRPASAQNTNWTISSDNVGTGPSWGNGAPYMLASSGQLFMDAGFIYPAHAEYFSTLEVTTIAAAAGVFSFDFSITLGTLNVSDAYYIVNGMHHDLPNGSGQVTNVQLNTGDVFGFGVHDGNASLVYHLDPEARLTITNFSAPVPEPYVTTLLVASCLVVMCFRLLHGRRS